MAGQAELTSRQRRSLAEDGFLLVPALLAVDIVAALAARLYELARAFIAEKAAAGVQWEEAGVVRVRLDAADPGYAPSGPAAPAVQRHPGGLMRKALPRPRGRAARLPRPVRPLP